VEGNEDGAAEIEQVLQGGGLAAACEHVRGPVHLKKALQSREWDMVISAFFLPEFGETQPLAIVLEKGLDIPFIAVFDTLTQESAVEMVKAGADDCVARNGLHRLPAMVRQELKAAQERRVIRQTKAQAAYLASIVESCDDAIVGTDLDGRIVSWNASAERLYGYAAAEMIGQSMSLLFHPYRPQDFPEFLETIKNGERVEGVDTVRLRRDGATVEVSVAISPIRDGSGRIIGASDLARDITRRRQEENERLKLIEDLTQALAKANTEAEHQRASIIASQPIRTELRI
jgi:PAS domain S-box-containing protein